jgi:hypothetical protein
MWHRPRLPARFIRAHYSHARGACLLCVTFVSIAAFASGCDTGDRGAPASARTESDQQVKKLREDNELEFQDLRGRWLAAKGELIRVKTESSANKTTQVGVNADTTGRLERIEAALIALGGDIESMRRDLTAPPPPDDTRVRLARSYEEIFCLRKRGAEEAVADVYRRYGFETLEDWASAWTLASRDETFERDVSARVQVLCP